MLLDELLADLGSGETLGMLFGSISPQLSKYSQRNLPFCQETWRSEAMLCGGKEQRLGLEPKSGTPSCHFPVPVDPSILPRRTPLKTKSRFRAEGIEKAYLLFHNNPALFLHLRGQVLDDLRQLVPVIRDLRWGLRAVLLGCSFCCPVGSPVARRFFFV